MNIVEPDMKQPPGHIVCLSESRSKIVAQVRNSSRKITAVLDLNRTKFSTFDILSQCI